MPGVKAKLKKAQDRAKKLVREIKKVEQFANAPMRTSGRAIGGKLGNRKAGEAIGGVLGRVFGTGDYYVKSNSLAVRGGPTDAAPMFTRAGRGMRVTHREFVGNVIASSTAGQFLNSSYALNPGNSACFPWLASIAQNFDQWQPNGIVVTYKNMSSSYSGTASLGTVVLASDYDVFDAPYATKAEMENSEFCVSANCATDLIHPIECNLGERFTKVLNVRNGSIPSGDSKRFYDLCNLQVATQGATADQLCGEMWISYDITFYKEQLPAPMSNRTPYLIIDSTSNYAPSGTMFGGGTFNFRTNTAPSGEVDTIWNGSGDFVNGISVTSNSVNDFGVLFSPRYNGMSFLIRMLVTGGSQVTTAPSITYTSCVPLDNTITAGGNSYTQTGTLTSQLLEWTLTVEVDAIGADPWFSTNVFTKPANPVDIRLIVMTYNSDCHF